MLDNHLSAEATKDHLTAARMATLLYEAKNSNAVAFRNEVLPLLYEGKLKVARAGGNRVRKAQEQERVVHQQTLDALLADLIWASGHVEARGYCFRSANRQEFTSAGTKASSRVYEWQAATLEAIGLIDRRMGYKGVDDWEGEIYEAYRRATRLRATPGLVAMALHHGIHRDNLADHYLKLRAKITAPVVLKAGNYPGGKGKRLKVPNTAQAASIRGEVERINAIYDRHQFEGLPQPQVYRLFNCADEEGFSFNKGGRLYGDFQSISPEQRKDVRIDGQPVVELDLKASHLTVLHGITNTPMPEGDLYDIQGLPRAVVKAVVTIMMGRGRTDLSKWSARNKEELLIKLSDEQPMDPKVFGKLYPMKATATKVLNRHPVLSHLAAGRLDWADLQYLESQVLVATILELGEKHGIPALPVHDSIIVPRKATELSHTCLARTFERISGQIPKIKMT